MVELVRFLRARLADPRSCPNRPFGFDVVSIGPEA